jgi:4-amino-4-deoxy-L-arabinose transferase-like glycosyltransferase
MNGFRGPFYYLVLGVVSTLLRDGFLAAKLISVLSAGASVLLLGRMFERLWGPKAGLLGALFVAGNVTLVPLAFRAGTDPLFLLLTVSVLALMLGGREGRAREWALAGAGGGGVPHATTAQRSRP